MRYQLLLATLATMLLLGGCGGESSSTPAPTPTPTPAVTNYNLNAAYVANLTKFGDTPIVLASQVTNGITIRGTGTATSGQLVTATFEGNSSALSKTESAKATFTDPAQTTFESAETSYFDTNYRLLGKTGAGVYAVVTEFNALGTAVTPESGTSMVFYKANLFTDATKKTALGSLESSYSFLAGTTLENRRWVLTESYKGTDGVELQRKETTYLVTPEGGITKQIDKITEGNTVTFLAY